MLICIFCHLIIQYYVNWIICNTRLNSAKVCSRVLYFTMLLVLYLMILNVSSVIFTAALMTQTCDFDVDLCGWTQDFTDTFDWWHHAGPTKTVNTGPDCDRTLCAKGIWWWIIHKNIKSLTTRRYFLQSNLTQFKYLWNLHLIRKMYFSPSDNEFHIVNYCLLRINCFI